MTDQTEKQEAKKAPAIKPQVVRPARTTTEASIYIGPALQGGKLARYTIFKGGVLPPSIAAIAREHKAIKRLIVPVSKLAEYETRLRDSSSPEAALFAEAAKIFSKGGK